MTFRSWLALPFDLLAMLVEIAGEWICDKLFVLSQWITGDDS